MEYSGIEIHTLICNKDLLLAINNFKSLQESTWTSFFYTIPPAEAGGWPSSRPLVSKIKPNEDG